MKELSIEQKAKAYDKAIEKLRDFYRDYDMVSNLIDVKEELAKIFHELKESEDERIRKWLIGYFNQYIIDGMPLVFGNGLNVKDVISWLEKQGEQKPTLPKWKYKNDNTPLLRDSLILNKYGCVAKSPSGAFVNDVWVIDYDELAKLPKEELEKQGEQETLCDKCRKEHPSHSCQDITELGRCSVEYEQKTDNFYCQESCKGFQETGKCFADGDCKAKREAESTNKVEPKFKVGDWIIFNGLILYIKEVIKGYYRTISKGGITNSYDWNIDNAARLWTIKDAKDGDVLACESGWTCIFKTLVNDENFSSYCFMDNTKWFCETGSECHTLKEEFVKAYNGKIYPATKEQRNTLFATMKEAGYIWIFSKKELIKVEQNPTKWSDEDERNMQNIDTVLFYDKTLPEDTCVKLRNFLKTLKQRIGE